MFSISKTGLIKTLPQKSGCPEKGLLKFYNFLSRAHDKKRSGGVASLERKITKKINKIK